MSLGFVAFHYPAPEYVEEFVGRTRQVRGVLASQPGFVRAETWVTPEGDAVVTTGEFESPEAFQGAFAAVAGELGEAVAFDEREVRPRQVHTLLSR
ncbi:antibiotic biosynthesis monooxygenase family protein [Actinomadura oligospora]|uniref:antibiotic biosynthesis monooxygenase family protein n=1 Tax=Actinomadura oligospora TaxID=111804 RepID=UPI00047B6877|nr:antibiotic biosynthesis monooxygenase [Actinomadura oligospora]